MKKILTLFILFASVPSFSDYENYDDIVDKLSKYSTIETKGKKTYKTEVQTYSKVHMGLGLSQTFYDADAVALNSRMQNQGGLMINIGVDLLSQKWGLEGSYSNFGTANTDNSQVRLKEFALKGLYKTTLTETWRMRLGLGMSSRFLDISNAVTQESYKTPSALFLFGIDSYISQMISVGADLGLKTALINDTIDKNSLDLSFRIDTHF